MSFQRFEVWKDFTIGITSGVVVAAFSDKINPVNAIPLIATALLSLIVANKLWDLGKRVKKLHSKL